VKQDQDQGETQKGKTGGGALSRSARPPWVDDWQPPKPKTYAGFPPTMFLKLAEHHAKTRYVSGPELAFAIEKNPGVALSKELQGYLCRLLRGEVERPARGPTNSERFEVEVRASILMDYEMILRDVKRERKESGRRKTKTEDAAHVEAKARLKKKYRRYFKGVPETVGNTLSEWRRALAHKS
jgi:hypothetical protein